MGEEKKKEKNRAEGSNTNSKNTLLKKIITQHQIFMEAVGFQMLLLGSCSSLDAKEEMRGGK